MPINHGSNVEHEKLIEVLRHAQEPSSQYPHGPCIDETYANTVQRKNQEQSSYESFKRIQKIGSLCSLVIGPVVAYKCVQEFHDSVLEQSAIAQQAKEHQILPPALFEQKRFDFSDIHISYIKKTTSSDETIKAMLSQYNSEQRKWGFFGLVSLFLGYYGAGSLYKLERKEKDNQIYEL
jgi:hypothetical protein